MSISAMKQAVKALEFAAGLISPITKGCQCQICLAHKALRQAIEQAEKPKTRPATREEKIVNPGVYEVPVHAIDISQERVDETAKDRHEWVGLTEEERAECWSSSAVQSAINLEAKLKEKNVCIYVN